MIDIEARRVIEALRAGVPSRAVGQYFSSARQDIISPISKKLEGARENGVSTGMVVTGKYGEGKTHLLNTVFNMAQSANMVVSLVSLGKETPLGKPYLVYQKLLQNTYLPNRLQPGFLEALSNITNEISPIIEKLTDFYNRSYFLRTRIRAVVECMDQLYQYNRVCGIRIDELGRMLYDEDVPELPL